MANLLNVIQLVNNPKIASPEDVLAASKNQESVKGQDVSKLFEETLNTSISSIAEPETPVDLKPEDETEVVELAMNFNPNPIQLNSPVVQKNQDDSGLEVKENSKNKTNQQPTVIPSKLELPAGVILSKEPVTPKLMNVEAVSRQPYSKVAEEFKPEESKANHAPANLNQSIIRQMNRSFDQSLDQAKGKSVRSTETPSVLQPMMEWQIKDDEGVDSVGEDFVEVQDLWNEKSAKDISRIEAAPVKVAPSKLSTDDFMSLRDLSKNPTKPTSLPLPGLALGTKAESKAKVSEKSKLSDFVSGLAPALTEAKQTASRMEATVMQTPGQKPVLASESLVQIANQVNLLGKARQDGEIKIKLRPDHLGDLQMSVRTVGQNVTVQIKAQSEEAKKIIEDSISSLREHLSQHQLSLSSIDVISQPVNVTQSDSSSLSFDSNSGFNQFGSQNRENNSKDGSSSSDREYFQEQPLIKPQSTMNNRMRLSETSRLDLIA